jgi:hypothetical protein
VWSEQRDDNAYNAALGKVVFQQEETNIMSMHSRVGCDLQVNKQPWRWSSSSSKSLRKCRNLPIILLDRQSLFLSWAW